MFGLIRKLIPLAIVAVIGWVVYVSFYGTEQERDMRDNLGQSLMQVGQSIGNIFNHESEKFEQGTYDDAINTLSDALNNLRTDNNETKNTRKSDYDTRLAELNEELEALKNAPQKRDGKIDEETIKKIEALATKIDALDQDMHK